MGAGAALAIPASLSIVNDVFRDPAERARAIGIWAGTIGLGIAIGPIAGGLLLAKFWWGSVFLVNVPVVVVALIGTLVFVPDSKNPMADKPDPAGAVLSIGGLGLLLWAIIEAPTQGWTSWEVIGVGLGGLAVLGAFVSWEAHSLHPMLKLSFFRDRRFSVAAAAECLGVFGLLGALFVQTQFLQFDLGFSPLQAGLRILPMASMLVVSAALSPIIGRLIGLKLTVAVGLAAVAGGLGQDLSGINDRHDLRRSRARPAADRLGGRPPPADGDELCGGIGPPRRLRGRIGLQCGRTAGRWSARRRRRRQRALHSLPKSHDRGARRPARAGGCRA